MTSTYLLEIIKALKPTKRHELGVFLTSKHLNRGKNADEIIKLYQLILDSAPDFSSESLTKEKLCFQIFSTSKAPSGRWEKILTDLNRLLRIFALTQQYFSEHNEDQQQLDWAKWLRTNGLAEHAQKTLLKLKTKRDRENPESLERYHFDLLLAEEAHEWESVQNQFKGDLKIPALIYSLDQFHYNYRTELINRYLLQQKGTQLPDLEIEAVWLDFYHDKSILLRISKKIYHVLKKDFPTVGEFQELIELLQANENTLAFQTRSQFYAFLRSACTLLINSGHLDFYPILHKMHKDNLERGYFFINGAIPPNVYLNLVVVAHRVEDIGWAKNFTEQYRNKVLGDDERQFFYRLNMTNCLFAEGKFDEALNYIPEAPSNSHYHHKVRRLEIKIYYEQHSDLLLYKIDAFRKFIVRTATKTISANLRKMDLNFLNILIQLTQTARKDKARSARMITRIEGKKLLADRPWLLEKARELG